MIVHLPAVATQREFMEAVLYDDAADIIGFGGARGGGKTYVSCLVMCLRRLMLGNTRGIMLRRTQGAADQSLKNEIEKVLYNPPEKGGLGLPRGTVRYRVNDRLFVFPNGATIKLGYAKLDSDYEQYQGVEYTDIAWEELTQHPKSAFDKINGSNRTNNPQARPKIWGTMNPGGIGMGWVKEYFLDNRAPNVRFIQSLIVHNLATLENDPGYCKRVLDPLPDWQRRQWRDGDWNAIAGGYFSLPPQQIREREIPYWADWVGGVDWGRAAPFCCLQIAQWQDAGGNRHCHVVREIYKRGLELDEQAEMVLESEADLVAKQILNAERVRYYADPSTAKAIEGVSTEAGRTIRGTWANYGFYALAAHTNARVPGWELLKLLISRGILTIDPSCKALLKELRAAVYEGTVSGGEPQGEDIDPQCPDHACFVAGTLISTDRGDIPIESLMAGDMVLTRDGYRPIRETGMTSADAEVWKVGLSNGRALVGTGNHPIWIKDRGWARLDTLRYGILLYSKQPFEGEHSKWTNSFPSSALSLTGLKRLRSRALSFVGIQTRGIIRAVATLPPMAPTRRPALAGSMKRCGSSITDRSRKGTTSTTEISTRKTTTSPTSNASPGKTIVSFIQSMATNLASILRNGSNILLCSANGRRNGIRQKKGASGTPITQRGRGSSESRPNIVASSAESPSPLSSGARCDFARMPANPRGGARQTSIQNHESVRSAAQNSSPTSTPQRRHAPVSVQTCFLAGRSAVYNLSVDGTPEFFANGVLVHNCDSLRYCIVSTYGLSFVTDQRNPWIEADFLELLAA